MTEIQIKVLQHIYENDGATYSSIHAAFGMSNRATQHVLAKLRDKRYIETHRPKGSTTWRTTITYSGINFLESQEEKDLAARMSEVVRLPRDDLFARDELKLGPAPYVRNNGNTHVPRRGLYC